VVETGSGVNQTLVNVNGGAWQVYTAPFTLPHAGDVQYIVGYYSTDNVGHVETTHYTTLQPNIPPVFSQQVFIHYYSSIGWIGLPGVFDSFKTFINGTRITTYNPIVTTPTINLTLLNYADTVVYTAIINVTGAPWLDIGIPVAEISFTNNYNFTVVIEIGQGNSSVSITIGQQFTVSEAFALGNYTCSVYHDGTLILNGTLQFSQSNKSSFSVQIGPITTTIPNVINTYPNPIVEIAIFGALLALVLGAIDLTARSIGMRRKKATPRSRGPFPR
jgi:hypothetical protein